MNWKDALHRWQRWARERRSQRDPLSWLQRSPDELTILGEQERAGAVEAKTPATPRPATPRPPEPRSPEVSPPPSRDASAPPIADTGEMTLIDVTTQPEAKVLAVLVALEGELEGEVFSLRDGAHGLGRSSASEVVLPSRWVSRKHAHLDCSPGRFVLTAVSDKQTLVNGEPLEPGSEHARALEDGDEIQLGRTCLRLRTVE